MSRLSRSRRSPWALVIVVLVGVLVAVLVTTVVIARANRFSGTPSARDQESEAFEFDDMPTTPEQLWSVSLAGRGLSVYPWYTSSVGGDPLVYLLDEQDRTGHGEIVRLDALSGERQWTAALDHPTSCVPDILGRHLPCYRSAEAPRELRYLDLVTGELTESIRAAGKVLSVLPVVDDGTEFLVAMAGPRPGEVTVHRGTPTDVDAIWTRTYRIAEESPLLIVDRKRGQGYLGYRSEPRESVAFGLATGAVEEDAREPIDENLWTWSERTSIRVHPQRLTFEILDAVGRVVGRGTDAGNNAERSRTTGTGYLAVALIGTSAYDTATGAELWSDERLRRPDDEHPLEPNGTQVAAIMNDTVVLRLGGDTSSLSLVGLDLRTGRELWRKDYRSERGPTYVDSTRWINIIDGRVQAIDTVTGKEAWSLEYRDARSPGDDRTRLSKLARKSFAVATGDTVTVYRHR